MKPDILVRKGVLGLALAGLMTAGVGQAQGKNEAKEANRDVKKNTKQAKVHKTHKPKIKSWRDDIQKGPFG